MPKLTATETFRAMLDERGVKWTSERVKNGVRVNNGVLFTFAKDGRTYSVFVRDRAGLEIWSQYLTPEQAIASTLGAAITGETSDGYHTFNELYHHRAILFSVIVRDHKELAWKSKAHNDGTMYDGMFIVGIETPQGQATYHYDIDPYWDMFECKELDRAPEWDGHSPADAIERIATLGTETCHDKNGFDPSLGFECTVCGTMVDEYMVTPIDYGHQKQFRYCPGCGARVVDE